MALEDDRVPVSVLTGFLGSGKTTLLNRLLRHAEMGETAVIVNEFGEVGIDNALIVGSSDQVLLLESGCICCSVRGDLLHTLNELMGKRKQGTVPPFQRVVIETTGLADPAPVLQSLMTDMMMLNCFRMGPVVTVVDSYHGARSLDRHAEAVKQAALADRLVLSKGDIAASGAVAELRARLRRLNPVAPIMEALHGDVSPGRLFGAATFSVAGKADEVRLWLKAELPGGSHDQASAEEDSEEHASHGHSDRIHAHCLTFREPLEWEEVAGWLDGLALEFGEHLLRVKGLLNVRGQEEPVVIQGVHHLFHPPSTLPAWPDADRRSRLVFIVRALGREALLSHAPADS